MWRSCRAAADTPASRWVTDTDTVWACRVLLVFFWHLKRQRLLSAASRLLSLFHRADKKNKTPTAVPRLRPQPAGQLTCPPLFSQQSRVAHHFVAKREWSTEKVEGDDLRRMDWMDAKKTKKSSISGVNKISGYFSEFNFFVLIKLKGGLCCMCIMVISWGYEGVGGLLDQSECKVVSASPPTCSHSVGPWLIAGPGDFLLYIANYRWTTCVCVSLKVALIILNLRSEPNSSSNSSK